MWVDIENIHVLSMQNSYITELKEKIVNEYIRKHYINSI